MACIVDQRSLYAIGVGQTVNILDVVYGHDAEGGWLVNQVLPKEQLLPRCREIAAKIATRGPLAVARAKRLVERGYDMTLRAANRQEAESFALLFDTQDRREGMSAFVEKRPAKFTGR